MKQGLTKRYRKFGWEFYELLDWRRSGKVRKSYKKSFNGRARANDKKAVRDIVLSEIC